MVLNHDCLKNHGFSLDFPCLERKLYYIGYSELEEG